MKCAFTEIYSTRWFFPVAVRRRGTIWWLHTRLSSVSAQPHWMTQHWTESQVRLLHTLESHLSHQAPWAYQERSWGSTLAVQQGQTSTSRPGISSSPIKMTQTKPCHLWCLSLPTRRTSRFRYLSRIRVSCSIWYVSFLMHFWNYFCNSIKGKICDLINLSKESYWRSIWQLSYQLGIWRKKQSDWPFPTSHQTWSRYWPE